MIGRNYPPEILYFKMRLSSSTTIPALAWYLFFGVLHELSHVVVAVWFGLYRVQLRDVGSICKWIFHFMFEKRWEMAINNNYNTCDIAMVERQIDVVRHSGWIFSLTLAVAVGAYYSYYAGREKNSIEISMSAAIHNPMVWAAALTAIEAISTDLVGLENYILPLLPIHSSSSSIGGGGGGGKVVTFFCGNFGLILLNPAYNDTKSGRKIALDILEKMISVTMVRGAQSGGVVSFVSRSSRHADQITGMRSRVLNSKRSDLSKGIRSKIESDTVSKEREGVLFIVHY